MAIDCTPASLIAASECLDCSMTRHQLLAALVYVLCTTNNMSCTPSSLVAESECIRCSMNERQMLASIVYLLCSGGAAGGVGQIVEYTTTPTADGVVPGNLNAPAIAVKPGATTYIWDPVAHVWDDH